MLGGCKVGKEIVLYPSTQILLDWFPFFIYSVFGTAQLPLTL